MQNGAQIRIAAVQISERAPQKREQLRFVMIGFGAQLDQLDKVGRGLRSPEIFADAAEWILEHNFCQRMQIRFAAARDLDFGFEKQIQLTRKRTFRAARAFRGRLDAA